MPITNVHGYRPDFSTKTVVTSSSDRVLHVDANGGVTHVHAGFHNPAFSHTPGPTANVPNLPWQAELRARAAAQAHLASLGDWRSLFAETSMPAVWETAFETSYSRNPRYIQDAKLGFDSAGRLKFRATLTPSGEFKVQIAGRELITKLTPGRPGSFQMWSEGGSRFGFHLELSSNGNLTVKVSEAFGSKQRPLPQVSVRRNEIGFAEGALGGARQRLVVLGADLPKVHFWHTDTGFTVGLKGLRVSPAPIQPDGTFTITDTVGSAVAAGVITKAGDYRIQFASAAEVHAGNTYKAEQSPYSSLANVYSTLAPLGHAIAKDGWMSKKDAEDIYDLLTIRTTTIGKVRRKQIRNYVAKHREYIDPEAEAILMAAAKEKEE